MVDVARVQLAVDSRQVRQANQDLGTMDRRGGQATRSVDFLKRAVVALGGALSVREVIRYADGWRNVSNQLSTVTDTTAEQVAIQTRLVQTANDTRSQFESTANLYARLARSTTELNLTQDELIGLTTTINQSFAVSGATAEEASNAITQLSQGLAAGALRGEEFNSVSEQSPILMRAIADSLDMTIGELRSFAAEGGITAEIVIGALTEASDEIDAAFTNMTATFGQNMTVARNNLMEFVGSSDTVQDAVLSLGETAVAITENLDRFAAEFGIFGDNMSVAMSGTFNDIIGGVETLDHAFTTFFAETNLGAISFADALSVTLGTTIANIRSFIQIMTVESVSFVDRLKAESTDVSASLARGLDFYLDKVGIQIDGLREHWSEAYTGPGGIQEQIDTIDRARRESIAEFLGQNDDTLEALYEQVSAGEELRREYDRVAASQDRVTTSAGLMRDGFVAVGDSSEETNPILATLRGTTDVLNTAFEETEFRMKGVTESQYEVSQAVVDSFDPLKAQQNMIENLQKEWANLIFDTLDQGKFSFESFFDTVIDGYKRMIAELASKSLINAIFGGGGVSGFVAEMQQGLSMIPGLGGGSGGGGGIIGSITQGNTAQGLSNIANIFSGGSGGSGAGVNNAFNMPGLGGVNPMTLAQAGSSGGLGIGGVFNAAGPGGVNPMTLSQAGGGGGLLSSAGGFISKAAPWAAAAFAVYEIGKALDNDDGYERSMAGFEAAPSQVRRQRGVDMFDMEAFASGFDPMGVAHRSTREQAEAATEPFRELDATITDLIKQLEGSIDTSNATFSGTSMDGQFSDAGTVLGMGGKTSEADMAAMLDRFGIELVKHAEGLDQEVMDALQSASGTAEAFEILNSAVRSQAAAASNIVPAASNIVPMATQREAADEVIDQAFNIFTGEVTGMGLRQARRTFNRYESEGVLSRDVLADVGGFSMSEVNQALDGSHRNGLDFVPRDGYRAELHAGERIQTASQARDSDNVAAEIRMMRNDLNRGFFAVAKNTAKLAKLEDRWDKNGLPEARTA